MVVAVVIVVSMGRDLWANKSEVLPTPLPTYVKEAAHRFADYIMRLPFAFIVGPGTEEDWEQQVRMERLALSTEECHEADFGEKEAMGIFDESRGIQLHGQRESGGIGERGR